MKLHFSARIDDFIDAIRITTPDGDRLATTDVYISLLVSLGKMFGFDMPLVAPYPMDGRAFIVSSTIMRGRGVVVAQREEVRNDDAVGYRFGDINDWDSRYFEVCSEGLMKHFGKYPKKLYFKRNERLDV